MPRRPRLAGPLPGGVPLPDPTGCRGRRGRRLANIVALVAGVGLALTGASPPLEPGNARLRLVVDLAARRLYVLDGRDTVRSARAAVASGETLSYAGRSWVFRPPLGRHVVLAKRANPVWVPPDWLYAQVASEYGLALRRLTRQRAVTLRDGTRLVVRDNLAGLIEPGSREFLPLPVDEHIVFDGALFIPPFGTWNRRVRGELGHYALDLGNGYLIHGTPDTVSIGHAITHGCIRLGDADIAWLYRHVPVGTPILVRRHGAAEARADPTFNDRTTAPRSSGALKAQRGSADRTGWLTVAGTSAPAPRLEGSHTAPQGQAPS